MLPLHRAAQNGEVAALRQLLSAGADVAASDYEGRTALHCASYAGKEESVRVLLEAAEEQGRLNAVLNAVDKYGNTPLDECDDARCFSLLLQRGGRGRLALHRAVLLGHMDALRQLLSAGADVTATDSDGTTALHWASLRERVESLRVLLEAAEEQRRLDAVLNAVDKDGKTPLDVCRDATCFSLLLQRGGGGREALHRAAQRGFVDALRQLLCAGADVAATNSAGRTALHWASMCGREESVRVLLETADEQGRLDAVLNAVDNNGDNPLDVCRDARCFSLLLQRGGRCLLALHRAAGFGNVDALKELLGAGVDVATCNSTGWTALHVASSLGMVESVQVLLDAAEEQGRLDAVLNAVDKDGKLKRPFFDVCRDESCAALIRRRALVKAAKCDQMDALRNLLGTGTDVAASDPTGKAALHWASLRGRGECVRVLLEAAEKQRRLDAVLDAVDEDGDTPLDVAQDRTCVSLLLQRGGRGRDALHKAAKWGLTDVLRELLSAGADVATPDCTGRNALHWAAAEGWEECVRLLLEAAQRQDRLHAVLSAVDQGGSTPLHVSWHEGCSSLMRTVSIAAGVQE